MEMTQISGECPDGVTCPAVFATDEGTAIVRGNLLTEDMLATLCLGENEYAVEIPLRLIREAAGRC
jgi:hypothetical protein